MLKLNDKQKKEWAGIFAGMQELYALNKVVGYRIFCGYNAMEATFKFEDENGDLSRKEFFSGNYSSVDEFLWAVREEFDRLLRGED